MSKVSVASNTDQSLMRRSWVVGSANGVGRRGQELFVKSAGNSWERVTGVCTNKTTQ